VTALIKIKETKTTNMSQSTRQSAYFLEG